MSKITLSFMQRFMGELNTAIKNYVADKVSNKQDTPTILSQTLATGNTSVTFTNVPTIGVNIIDVYTSVAGLDYESIDDSTAGTLVITYEAQESNVTVYLRIERYSA